MEIVKVTDLKKTDRFAFSDWNKHPEKRIMFRLSKDPKDTPVNRKTLDIIQIVRSNDDPIAKTSRINKETLVFKL